ncbi:helix-turn-helix domain-containing protein [Acidovorax sp. Leaf84]|uniref:helix-turn-helix domain-containing protein n=1 Tax=Acidovorax sp. Leaf84 TaxID=1736240 RepID=UPI000A73A73D|nr:helix-turn-helix domain-containing protein [Acidovorax sp. Leaf84]
MKKYQTDFKLKVVKSFMAGDGRAKLLARQWSVPEEKIRTWVSHYRLHGIDGLRPKRSTYSAQFILFFRPSSSEHYGSDDICSGGT